MPNTLPDNLKPAATPFGPIPNNDPVQIAQILASIKAAGMVPFITPAPDLHTNYWGVRPEDIPTPTPPPPPPPKTGWW